MVIPLLRNGTRPTPCRRSCIILASFRTKIWNVVTSTNEVDRWDWVTQVAEGWGGVVDDAVTDMAVG